MHQGLASVQPARCARRHLGHGTAGLYSAHPRAGEGLWRRLARDGWRRCACKRCSAGKRLMPELLIELLSEEVPARMQERAAEDFRKLMAEGLAQAGLEAEGARAFASPRRLTLSIDELPGAAPDTLEERKGPRTD